MSRRRPRRLPVRWIVIAGEVQNLKRRCGRRVAKLPYYMMTHVVHGGPDAFVRQTIEGLPILRINPPASSAIYGPSILGFRRSRGPIRRRQHEPDGFFLNPVSWRLSTVASGNGALSLLPRVVVLKSNNQYNIFDSRTDESVDQAKGLMTRFDETSPKVLEYKGPVFRKGTALQSTATQARA